jgi:hypothetical protein
MAGVSKKRSIQDLSIDELRWLLMENAGRRARIALSVTGERAGLFRSPRTWIPLRWTAGAPVI